MKKLINWSNLSIRLGLDRNAIRGNKRIPKKHFARLDKLFLEEIPNWWKNLKNEND